MQNSNALIEKLGYVGFLTKISDLCTSHPGFEDISKLEVDNVYFSGDKPAALFVDVNSFDTSTLQRINRIHNNAWNYRKVLFLFVQSPTEIRVYNCYEKPVFLRKNECNSDAEKKIKTLELIRCSNGSNKDNLKTFLTIFSRIGVDSGSIWTDEKFRNKINLQHRLDKYLVTVLSKTADELKEDGLSKDIIHGLLIRSLFILFLEDKGAAKEAGLYESIKKGCDSYFDILKDKNATYLLFEKLQSHFNGNITPLLPHEKEKVSAKHLNLVRNCFMDGDVSGNPSLFTNCRLFNFKIIQVELLSEIYELFLGELKHERGQYYTPHGLVNLILEEELPIDNPNYNVKILDPACGSGIFLVESYRRLIARWKYKNHTDKISFSELKKLLLNNIFGIEIDPTAIKVAAFSLYIALIDELDPKTLWIKDNYRLPYLIYERNNSNLDHNGGNLFLMDTIAEVDPKMLPEINLVVGNPPFGKKKMLPSIKEYCKAQKFATDTVIPFIHKSVQFCPKGNIALIFNTKILTDTNSSYCRFRKWLFNMNYVEKLYNLSILRKAPKGFGGQLFNSATGPVSIMFFKHNCPLMVSDTIEYWAPKTYVRSNTVDGVVINDNDVCHLPRKECQKPDTKIWKVAQWGNYSCFKLLKKLHRENGSLGEAGWTFCRGLNSEKSDFIPQRIIKTNGIGRYFTDSNAVCFSNTKGYRKERGKDKLFLPPFIIFSEGLHQSEIACSVFYKPCYCTTAAYITRSNNLEDMKYLVAYLNSDLAKFQLFLTSSTWGIERDRILPEEIAALSSPFVPEYQKERKNIIVAFDQIVELKKLGIWNDQEIKRLEQNILNSFIYLFKLSSREKNLIYDTVKFSFGLFKDGNKSVAFHRTLQNENIIYAETICKTLNIFLENTSIKASATVFVPTLNDPLNILGIHFGQRTGQIKVDNLNYSTLLSEIDKLLLQKKSPSIYIQKNLKYYDGNDVYFIKPNQKRFWTRSQAEEDATELIADIVNLH